MQCQCADWFLLLIWCPIKVCIFWWRFFLMEWPFFFFVSKNMEWHKLMHRFYEPKIQKNKFHWTIYERYKFIYFIAFFNVHIWFVNENTWSKSLNLTYEIGFFLSYSRTKNSQIPFCVNMQTMTKKYEFWDTFTEENRSVKLMCD